MAITTNVIAPEITVPQMIQGTYSRATSGDADVEIELGFAPTRIQIVDTSDASAVEIVGGSLAAMVTTIATAGTRAVSDLPTVGVSFKDSENKLVVSGAANTDTRTMIISSGSAFAASGTVYRFIAES